MAMLWPCYGHVRSRRRVAAMLEQGRDWGQVSQGWVHLWLERAGANRSLPMFASPIDPIALLESPPMQAWPGREQNVVSLFEGWVMSHWFSSTKNHKTLLHIQENKCFKTSGQDFIWFQYANDFKWVQCAGVQLLNVRTTDSRLGNACHVHQNLRLSVRACVRVRVCVFVSFFLSFFLCVCVCVYVCVCVCVFVCVCVRPAVWRERERGERQRD